MEMNQIFIRKAVPEDASGIHTVIQESFIKYCEKSGLDYTVEALKETVEDIEKDIFNKHVLVAILNDGIIAGTLRLEILQDRSAYLTRFGVLPIFHRFGIGGKLLDAAEDFLKASDVKKVYLHTAVSNKDLVRFYYDRGFRIENTSTDRGYIRALMAKDFSVQAVPVSVCCKHQINSFHCK